MKLYLGEGELKKKSKICLGEINKGFLKRGMVISTKMDKTIIIRRDYFHYIKKYNRFEKRHRNVPAHCSPCFSVKEGDIVTVGQCR